MDRLCGDGRSDADLPDLCSLVSVRERSRLRFELWQSGGVVDYLATVVGRLSDRPPLSLPRRILSVLKRAIRRAPLFGCSEQLWHAAQLQRKAVTLYSSLSSLRASRKSSRIAARFCKASFVKAPCLRALLLPSGAPDPLAPPCIRQRLPPLTAGERQEVPFRVFAPQRRLESIGSVLRLWVPATGLYRADLPRTRGCFFGAGSSDVRRSRSADSTFPTIA